MTKVCDKCNTKINPDNEGFEGSFYEFNDGAQMDLCEVCAADFSLIWKKFVLNVKKEESLV